MIVLKEKKRDRHFSPTGSVFFFGWGGPGAKWFFWCSFSKTLKVVLRHNCFIPLGNLSGLMMTVQLGTPYKKQKIKKPPKFANRFAPKRSRALSPYIHAVLRCSLVAHNHIPLTALCLLCSFALKAWRRG